MNKIQELINAIKEDETQNTDFGFFGTISSFDLKKKEVKKVWDAAIKLLQKIFNISDDDARRVLDSTVGRGLAEQMTRHFNSDEDNVDEIIKAIEPAIDDIKRDFRMIIRKIEKDPEAFDNE